MPKRLFIEELPSERVGIDLEPRSKLKCGSQRPPLHVQQMHEKTLDLLFRGANRSVILDNEKYIEKSSHCINDHTENKKNFRQMLLDDKLKLYSSDVNINLNGYMPKVCEICKTSSSEIDMCCNYCEFLQCSTCAMICSNCLKPTCNNCSINSFGNCDGIFCLSCCR